LRKISMNDKEQTLQKKVSRYGVHRMKQQNTFNLCQKDFLISYRVENIELLVQELRQQ